LIAEAVPVILVDGFGATPIPVGGSPERIARRTRVSRRVARLSWGWTIHGVEDFDPVTREGPGS